jgi:hypothetical protein
MAACNHCGRTIVMGGVRDGGLRFCKAACRDQSQILAASRHLPDGFVEEKARHLHAGTCARCGGRGPIDVHNTHTVWSAFVTTQWSSKLVLCCQSCGTKAKLRAIGFCGLFGWWGFPWGLVATPVQIFRNVGGLFSAPNPDGPSPEMLQHVRQELAKRWVCEEHEAAAAS